MYKRQAQGGAITGQGTTVVFPATSLTTRAVDTFSVTHIPLFRPSNPADEYAAALATFTLTAVDSSNQPIGQFNRAFDMIRSYAVGKTCGIIRL